MLPKEKNARGRQKQKPASNLLNQLRKYQDGALAFLTHHELPFDNRNSWRQERWSWIFHRPRGNEYKLLPLFVMHFSAQQYSLFLIRKKAHGMKGGDSSGISEKAETPQERSDEEAWSRPRKASARNEMCSQGNSYFLKG